MEIVQSYIDSYTLELSLLALKAAISSSNGVLKSVLEYVLNQACYLLQAITRLETRVAAVEEILAERSNNKRARKDEDDEPERGPSKEQRKTE